jgi:hypothetical protein
MKYIIIHIGLSKQKKTLFFLATDDHTTRIRAKEFFGDRVKFSNHPIVHSGMQQVFYMNFLYAVKTIPDY